MMLCTKTLPFILSTVVTLNMASSYDVDLSSLPVDERYMSPMFQWVYDNQEYIIQTMTEALNNIGPEMNVAETMDNIRERSKAKTEQCQGCKVEIELMNELISAGITYADVRDQAIDYCVKAEEESGYLGEVMCAGIADRYYPHAFYILEVGNFTSDHVCMRFNECERPEDYVPRDVRSHVRKSAPIKKDNTKPQPMKTRDLNNAVKMVIMSDIHVERQYLDGSATDCGLHVCCRGDNGGQGEGEAGLWGDYNCNVPPRTTELMLDTIAALDPEFIVYTGDSPPHVKWLETLTSQIGVTEWLTNALATHIPSVPVFPCIGNHEIYPADLYYTPLEEIEIFNAAFASNWQAVAGFEEEQISTVRKAGYYTQLLQPGLRILTFNSNYGYTSNWYNLLSEYEEVYSEMINFIEQTLANARLNNEKVILMSHHPHGDKGHILEDADLLNPLISSFSDVIVLYPIGHFHRDDFKLFINPETGLTEGVQMMNQAMQTLSFVNPGFRVVYLDPVTFTPLDYEQYSMNLTIQSASEPEINMLYRASEQYNLPDLTPQSYADLVDRFETDDDLFQEFYKLMNSLSVEVEPCINECKQEKLCWFKHNHYHNYKNCILNNV